MKQDHVDELKTYDSPKIKKIGSVKDLTQGDGAVISLEPK
jgi:hypothetical protein